MKHSDLHFGSEFSPSESDLSKLIPIKNRARPEITEFLRKPLSEILKEAKRQDKRTVTPELEAVAFNLIRHLELAYIGTRWRKGKGVQVFGERKDLVLKRWQLFCTNKSVDQDEVATEVGLMSYLGCDVSCIISTRKFLPRARRYTEAIRPIFKGALVLIDGRTLSDTFDRPKAFVKTVLSQVPFALVQRR